ncbi:MAG: hypothetical protein IIY58_03705 [Aeriscardovia sp.]|nr:hypothetical protein [Aeriscardovia sp.]
MDNEFIKKQIESLNKHLAEDCFNYPEDRYSFAAGFMEGVLEAILGEEIEINYKGEEK